MRSYIANYLNNASQANSLKNPFQANSLNNTIQKYIEYKKNSIITVNFDLSPKTSILGKIISRTIGDNDLPEDDVVIDDYSDYKFDIAIILNDYYEKEQKYKIMLGIGKIILVESTDIQSVIRYPHDKEYFGRNIEYVKQFNKKTNNWESVDKKTLLNDKKKYRTYQYNLVFQKMQAKLPPTYHYKLPQKNEICKIESSPSDKQKYSTNMIVIIKPYTWPSYLYEESLAIILDCNYETKNYKVFTFESSIDTIPEENILEIIQCPEDGEYFGMFQNNSMRFNGDANMWEYISLQDGSDEDIKQWEKNYEYFLRIQQKSPIKGGKYTRRQKNKKTKKVKKTRLMKISSRSLALR